MKAFKSILSCVFVFFCLFCSTHIARASVLVKPSNNLGLLASWNFNENSGTQAADLSGNNNTGTLSGPTWSQGKHARALTFDGVDDFVTIADSSSVQLGAGNFTIALWAKTSQSGNLAFLTKRSAGGNNGFFFGSQSTTTLLFYSDPGTPLAATSNSVTFRDGNWHHFVVVRSSNTLTFYLDATSAGSTGSYTNDISGSGQPLLIAKDAQIADILQGGLDDLRLYSRALTGPEISALYAYGASSAKQATNLGLVSYYSFDEGVGTQVGDSSGNANTATLGSSTTTPSWVTGKHGKALSFDGVNDVLTAPDSNSLDITTDFTISFWARGGMYVTKNSPDTSGAFIVYCSSSDGVASASMAITIRNAVDVTNSSAGNFNTGWVHCVMTHTGTAYAVYLDGVHNYTTNDANNPAATSANLLIGSYGAFGSYAQGLVDDLRIYNRALTASEVTQLYRSGATKINASQNANGPQSGLVGMWSFNGADLSGTTAYDRGTGGNNGTLTNGPRPISGKIGQALLFDGINDYVNLGPSQNFNYGNNFTLSAWVYPTASGGSSGSDIIQNEFGNVAPYASWSLQWSSAQKFSFGTGATDNLYETNPESSVYPLRQWYYVVATYDGFTKRVYVNGVADGSTPYSKTIRYTSGQIADVGTWTYDTANNSFPGKIDDVRIYNRALSAAEILRLYNLSK